MALTSDERTFWSGPPDDDGKLVIWNLRVWFGHYHGRSERDGGHTSRVMLEKRSNQVDEMRRVLAWYDRYLKRAQKGPHTRAADVFRAS